MGSDTLLTDNPDNTAVKKATTTYSELNNEVDGQSTMVSNTNTMVSNTGAQLSAGSSKPSSKLTQMLSGRASNMGPSRFRSAAAKRGTQFAANVGSALRKQFSLVGDPRIAFLKQLLIWYFGGICGVLVWILLRGGARTFFGDAGACFYGANDVRNAFNADSPGEAATCNAQSTKGGCDGTSGCEWLLITDSEGRSIVDGLEGKSCELASLEGIKKFKYYQPSSRMYAISDLAYTGTMWYASAAMTLYTYWRFHFFPEGWKNWMWTYTPWLVETWNWVNAFANGGFASTPRGGPATTLGPLLILLLSKPRCVPWTHALKCMKYIVYIVIYSNIGIYWGERVIPTVQATMVEVELNPLAVTAVNVGLATFFFSVIVPMGAQIMAAPMVAIARQWADRVGITDEEELMRLEMTGRILINVCFDAFRYAYGRGVLLKIGPLGFTIMLVKDFWYDFWHFVCQYEQSLIVFNLKLDASKHIPLGEIDLPPRTKMYAAFKRRHMQLNKLDVLTAICWKVPFDAAKRRQTTAHGVDPEGYLVNMIRQRSTVVQAVEKRATALAEGSGIVKRMTTWSRTPDNEYINARKSIRASRTSMRQQGVTASQDFKKSAALGSGAGRSSQILRGSRASARFADTVPENDVPNEETTNGQEEKELTEKEVLEVLAVETRDLLTDSYRVAEESMAQDADEEAVLGTPIMNKASDGSVKGGEQGDDEDEEEQAAMRKLATLAPDGTYARAFNFANTSVKCTNCPRLRPFSRVSRDDDDPSANARPTLNLRLTRLASRFQDKHKVDEEDIRRVRHVIAFVQREMFMRFTIRSIIKLVTSSVILFGPLFGLLTDISMSPGFPRPEKELTGTPRIDDQYFVYTLVFFLTDVAVWSLITFQVHFKGVLTWREMLGAYNDQMFSYGRLRPSATMVLWLGYWGQFMLALRWRAYGPIGPLQDAVGVEVEYKHFLHFCPGIYTNWM